MSSNSNSLLVVTPLRQKCDNTHKKDTLQAHYKHLESFLSSQVYFQAFSSGEIQAREKEQEQWIKYSKKVVKQRKKKERKKIAKVNSENCNNDTKVQMRENSISATCIKFTLRLLGRSSKPR